MPKEEALIESKFKQSIFEQLDKSPNCRTVDGRSAKIQARDGTVTLLQTGNDSTEG